MGLLPNNRANKVMEILEHKTVSVQLTEISDNLTDVAHCYATMGFIAKWTEQELIENITHIIQEQYFQAITRQIK